MITNIQLLRALAALGVVWYHTNFLLWNGMHTEFQGVSLFFVISGYIITLVSQKKNENFLAHRFIRIAPIYWIVTLLFIIFFYFLSLKYRLIVLALFPLLWLSKKDSPFFQKYSSITRYIPWLIISIMIILIARSFRHDIITAYYNNYFSLKALIASLLFIPYPDINGDLHPVIGIGWTLNLEIFFYLVFGLCLFINKKAAPLLTCCVLLLFKAYAYWIGFNSNLWGFYAHNYTSYFILGMLVYYVYEAVLKYSIPVSKTFACGFTIFSLAVILAANISPSLHSHEINLYPGPALLVFSVLLCHTANLRFKNKVMLLIGDASYSLYLTHAFILEAMRALLGYYHLPGLSESLLFTTIMLLLSIIFAVAFYLLIERPLLVKLRNYVDRKKLKPVHTEQVA